MLCDADVEFVYNRVGGRFYGPRVYNFGTSHTRVVLFHFQRTVDE